jgi:hypothetical protein
MRVGRDRSADGGIQCYRANVNEPLVDAAKHLFDLEAVDPSVTSASLREVARRAEMVAMKTEASKSSRFRGHLP